MFKPAAAAFAFAAGLFIAPAHAYDISALKVLGFSPDGRYFGFMQYGPRWDAGTIVGETYVIDASTDRFVQGIPVRLSENMKDDASSDIFAPELKAFLNRMTKRAAGPLGQHKISSPGAVIATVAEARTSEYESEPEKPDPGVGAAEVVAKHPKLGELKLTLDIKDVLWPRTSRLYPGKGAPLCSKEVDTQSGAAFRLTLNQGGRTTVLQDDKSIPASRNCASAYGIAEVHAFDRPDGKVTLAVIIGMKSRGHEGEDRTFLAVTRVLDR